MEVEARMCQCCGCGGHHHHRYRSRRFFTREERAKDLEEYVEDLRKELAAVEEQLRELKR
jgi:hypothetical protein